MKTIRAIIIDAVNREIREAQIEDSIYGIYRAGGFDCFCLGAPPLPNGDTLYVDDEGTFKPGLARFLFEGQPAELCGNGVIIGADEESNTDDLGCATDARSTLDEIRARVFFPLEVAA